MRIDAPAKINLNLNVSLTVDEAGYHLVETVMCPLELADSVSVEPRPGEGLSLVCEPDPVAASVPDRMRGNIAFRAAESLCARFCWAEDFAISIEKRIPSQAGLGGGSSDAAAVLRCVAALQGVSPTDPVVLEVASSLGADVPFFLYGTTMHLVGRGDAAVRPLPGLSATLVLVKPPVGVSTADAYRAFDRIAPAPVPARGLIEALRSGDGASAIGLASNNMTPASLEVAPPLSDVFAFLRGSQGGVGDPLLCGSGSCVALFTRDWSAAGQIALEARKKGWWSTPTRTRA